jgi:hypothetical protein
MWELGRQRASDAQPGENGPAAFNGWTSAGPSGNWIASFLFFRCWPTDACPLKIGKPLWVK